MGVIWPRYDGRVIQADTGLSAYYGGHVGYLEITSDGLFAGYAWGKLGLPETDAGAIDYLRDVIARAPGNPHLEKRLQELTAPPEAPADEETAPVEESPEDGEDQRVPPICGIS